jgi:hypothetical protein
MPIVIILIVLGLLIGGLSFVIEAFAWLLAVGIVLVLIGALLGARALRGRRRRPLESDRPQSL